MSVDLMVYAGLVPGVTDEEAYEALCDGEDDVAVDGLAIGMFVDEVLRRHPDLADMVWTGDRKRFASFTLPSSLPDAVFEEIEALIDQYGLRGWDPQTEEPIGRGAPKH